MAGNLSLGEYGGGRDDDGRVLGMGEESEITGKARRDGEWHNEVRDARGMLRRWGCWG